MNNILPNGMVLLQTNPDYAADLQGGKWHGWLFYKHPNGQWVSERKLSSWEVLQAEDQRDQNIVIQSPGVRAG